MTDLYNKHIFLQDGDLLTEEEKIFFKSVTMIESMDLLFAVNRF